MISGCHLKISEPHVWSTNARSRLPTIPSCWSSQQSQDGTFCRSSSSISNLILMPWRGCNGYASCGLAECDWFISTYVHLAKCAQLFIHKKITRVEFRFTTPKWYSKHYMTTKSFLLHCTFPNKCKPMGFAVSKDTKDRYKKHEQQLLPQTFTTCTALSWLLFPKQGCWGLLSWSTFWLVVLGRLIGCRK